VSAASKAAKVAKVAKLAGVAKAAPAAKTSLLAGGGMIAAKRASVLFAEVPDDASRVATYVARESNGAFRTVLRSGEQSTHAAVDLGPALRVATTPERKGVDVYLDLSAARAPELLPNPQLGERWFVMDASGMPHQIRVQGRTDGFERVIDVADATVDLSDFVEASLDETDETVNDEPPTWFYGVFTATSLLLVGVMVYRKRKRTTLG
jgi:hypothetical protein